MEFDRVTEAPPVRAAWDMVTVQLLEEFGPTLAGPHVSEDTDPDAAKLTFAVADVPL